MQSARLQMHISQRLSVKSASLTICLPFALLPAAALALICIYVCTYYM